jgi:hypothetical protein
LSVIEKAKRAPEPAAPPPEPTRAEQIADAAEQIGNAMEKLTGAPAPEEAPAPPQEQASEDEGEPTKLFTADDTGSKSNSPKPKFDFENLKFGSNFNSDE